MKNENENEDFDVLDLLSSQIDKMLDDLKLEEQKRKKEELDKEEEKKRSKHFQSSLSRKEIKRFASLRQDLFKDFSTFCDSQVKNVQNLCIESKMNFEFEENLDIKKEVIITHTHKPCPYIFNPGFYLGSGT